MENGFINFGPLHFKMGERRLEILLYGLDFQVRGPSSFHGRQRQTTLLWNEFLTFL